MFAQAIIMGRVTADLEQKTSTNGNMYVNFSVAVNRGKKDAPTVTFYRCVLFGDDAEKIIKAKVKKGSLLMISGDLDMTEYQNKNKENVTEPKITINHWEYVPISQPKAESNSTGSANSSASYGDDGFPEVDCDDELPL